jgi:PhoH-like ATPase
MQKTFVLDTNVLLHAPNCLTAFGDNKVVLTEAVMEELDTFKKGHSELNVNARSVARFLDKLREKGKLTDGVEMDNGGLLKVETNHRDVPLPQSWDQNKADNRILQVCKALKDEGEEVYLITKDIYERIKADIMGVISQDFESDKAPKLDDQYKGRRDVYVEADDLAKFFKDGNLALNKVYECDKDGIINSVSEQLVANEFLVLRSFDNPDSTALAKVNRRGNAIEKLHYDELHPFGVTPRNVCQRFMQESLMSDVSNAPLVILKGPAGTAKTFYSLAVGLEKVMEDKSFRRILVCRPNQSMDEDLGYLPGTEKEKIAPLMRPIMDNLETLVDSDKKHRYDNEEELADKVQELFERKLIDTQAVGFLRGRSIVQHWLIIDEAQNLTPKQAKAIITRAGEGTKIILCGDPDQIDNPFLDQRTNGLSYAAELMKGSPLCCIVTAVEEECVRSELAEEAIKRMK